MRSKEWEDLIEKEFECSKQTAKKMYHAMSETYKLVRRLNDLPRAVAEGEEGEFDE